MRSVLFVVNYFNDIDHNAPLMERLAQQGDKVILLCLTKYSLFSDQRIKRLLKLKTFHLLRLRLLPRTSGSSNEKTGSLNILQKLFRELIFSRFFSIAILRHFAVTHCVFTWGRPRAKGFQRQIFIAAKCLKVPTLCLPHGQNIYKNYDVNTYLRNLNQNGSGWPDFSSRDEFDKYVVQTPRHRRMLLDWGMNPEKVLALGSMRFDEKWIKQNAALYPPINIFQDEDENLKVVFFLPHWRYNVDEDSTIQLIAKIAAVPGIVLVVKGHTRGDSIDQRRYAHLSQYDHLIMEADHDSSPLIRWADVIINFGSSIAIEAIALRKPVINPAYLHTNHTVFDDTEAVLTTHSSQQTTDGLEQLARGGALKQDSQSIQQFLKDEVYAESALLDISDHYIRALL
jgi:CDP-glycerol glycerophosphotransferase (TagB/SpsB family)